MSVSNSSGSDAWYKNHSIYNESKKRETECSGGGGGEVENRGNILAYICIFIEIGKTTMIS